jgi:hypothetical protein
MTLETTIDTVGNIVTAGSVTVDTTPASPESVNVYDNGEVTINSSDPLGTDTEAFASFTSDGWTLLATNCTGTVSTFKNTLDDGAGNATFQGAVSGESIAGLAVTGRMFDTGGTVFNVIAYGADPTGVNDSSTAINNAIKAALQNDPGLTNVSHGGGIVYIPPGKYLIANPIVLYSGITLQGAGRGATVLIASASFADVSYPSIITTDNFVSLAGDDLSSHDASPYDSGNSVTYSSGWPGQIPWGTAFDNGQVVAPPVPGVTGPAQFTIHDLAIDGNKQALAPSGKMTGINLYGYDFIVENVDIRMMSGNGASFLWGEANVPGYPNGMESRILSCRFFYNQDHGAQFWGPHDSIISDSIFACNNLSLSSAISASQTPVGTAAGLTISPITTTGSVSNSDGINTLRIYNCESYGPCQTAALLVDLGIAGGLIKVGNCSFAQGTNGAVLVNGGNLQMSNCDISGGGDIAMILGETGIGYYGGTGEVGWADIESTTITGSYNYGIQTNNATIGVKASGLTYGVSTPWQWNSPTGTQFDQLSSITS